jgi:multicomponent Na+:H+ antiporter subunit D
VIAAVWVVILPLAGAVLVFLTGSQMATVVGLASTGATLAAASGLAWHVWTSGPGRYPIGGWGAPLGIELYADGLSTLMVLMTGTVGLVISWYAASYFAAAEHGPRQIPHPGGGPGPQRGQRQGQGRSRTQRRQSRSRWHEQEGFWPLWLFLLGALNALFLSSDIFNVYVTLELMGLAAIALIVLAGGPTAVAAGMRYLLAAFVASLAYLLGVSVLYAGFDTLDMYLLGERIVGGAPAWTALAVMTLGIAFKTALFPLHWWLPQAHASAPTPVSAALSGLVVKASFYILLRLWFFVFPEALTPVAGQLLGILGTAAIFWGSLQAFRQRTLKLLVAHSTVAQIGYLFVLMPLAMAPPEPGLAPNPGFAPWQLDAWKGGMQHVLAHAVAKASMFMAAGTIALAAGDDRISGLNGVGARLPVTTFAFGLAGVNLIGLPPSGGFVAKWFLLNAAIASGQWWWALVIAIGGLLSAGYLFLVVRRTFLPADHLTTFHDVPRALQIAPMILALLALGLGLRATEPLELVQIGHPFIRAASPGG